MVRLYYRSMEASEDQRTAAHGLLRQALAPDAPELRHDGTGRPYLPEGPWVSLSHTSGAVAVALGDAPVGVDVERVRPVHPGLPRRVMSDGEYAWFCARGQQPEDFFTLWTLKESYYKYLGTGLPGFPNGTEFLLEGDRWRLRGTQACFSVWNRKTLLLALCSQEQQVELTELTGSSD